MAVHSKVLLEAKTQCVSYNTVQAWVKEHDNESLRDQNYLFLLMKVMKVIFTDDVNLGPVLEKRPQAARGTCFSKVRSPETLRASLNYVVYCFMSFYANKWPRCRSHMHPSPPPFSWMSYYNVLFSFGT